MRVYTLISQKDHGKVKNNTNANTTEVANKYMLFRKMVDKTEESGSEKKFSTNHIPKFTLFQIHMYHRLLPGLQSLLSDIGDHY